MKMPLSTYDDVLALREYTPSAARGYKFEQVVREILPWDFRPPLAMVAKSEQLDAFFEWNSWHFLVEAKAVAAPIRRGDHAWEDFELKLRKRRGRTIGLFCALFEVSSDVIEAARDLNREGVATIIIHGPMWDDLAEERLPLPDLLRHMVLIARATFAPIPSSIRAVRKTLDDATRALETITNTCLQQSATFLRRHRLEFHDRLYVERGIDRDLTTRLLELRPSSLAATTRSDRRLRRRRELRFPPPQVFVLRDASGAGKTTLSVQLASPESEVLALARAALDPGIDLTLDVLQGLGPDFGLRTLQAIDRPLIFVVDSLDEARSNQEKHSEVLSLLRRVEDDSPRESHVRGRTVVRPSSLNEIARDQGLLAFPIALVFTVREEYWDPWQPIFEGRRSVVFRQQFSRFTPDEFPEAIRRYSSAYHYRFTGPLNDEMRSVLSVPFNLRIFSEASEFHGEVTADAAFPSNVLELYFERKRDDILKRQIGGLGGHQFLAIVADLAMLMIRKNRPLLLRDEAHGLICHVVPMLRGYEEDILIALASEQVVHEDRERVGAIRFRHGRFVEYLVALWAVRHAQRGNLAFLDEFIHAVMSSSVASIFRVYDAIRFICERQAPSLLGDLESYWCNSPDYMRANLMRLRTQLAHSGTSSESDLALVRRSTETILDPELLWDNFFVLAAKRNAQVPDVILDAFVKAWNVNGNRVDRWKLLARLHSRSLLLAPEVSEAVAASSSAKEWEVLLGSILDEASFTSTERITHVAELVRTSQIGAGPEWAQVWWLTDEMLMGRMPALGEVDF